MRTIAKAMMLCILLTGLIATSCRNRKKEATQPDLTAQLDSVMATAADFSGVVLVAELGKPIFHQRYGYLNFETKTPLDTSSIFELASVSKQFTAMMVMIMEEEGLLSFDDPLEKFIPGLPYASITIRHLLNHTSGLPDYQAIMDAHWDKTKVAGNDDNIEYLKKYHPEKLFEPGARYEYSNTGYMLLASVVERASGKDFIALCRDRIFVPLRMTSTGIRTRAEKDQLPGMAWGHLFVEEKQRYVPADSFPAFNYSIWLGNRKGPGRISSTSRDLLRWDQALYTEQLVKKETLAKAFAPATLTNGALSNYGFGWELMEDPIMGKIVRHTGDNPGYKTIIERYIDKHVTIILLCNNAHRQFKDLSDGLEAVVRKHYSTARN